jgi:hypothetical protein
MKLALLLLLAATLASAQKTNWANVKTLPVGGEIRVSLDTGKAFRGQLQSVTDESLIIVAASSQETLPRPQIMKVATKGDGHRMRNALIGLAIGAGGGLAIGAGIDHGTCKTCFFRDDNVGKIIFTPIGAIVGTVVGVAWPTGTWHEVYRSK